MPVARETGGGDYKPAPAGTHIARCVQVIDLGTQYSERYQKAAAKVLLGWELPNELKEATEDRPVSPYLVWARYTCSLHPKAKLREVLESWRGKAFSREELQGFDLRRVLDVPCLLSIVHNENDGKTYANVSAVMSPSKGTPIPDRVHDLVYFDVPDWLDGGPGNDVFETFSDNLKETIRSCEEYKAASQVGSDDDYSEPIDQDDNGEVIPF